MTINHFYIRVFAFTIKKILDFEYIYPVNFLAVSFHGEFV